MSTEKRKLLIVDDDEGFLESLRRSLSSNFDVSTASTMPEARAAFENDPEVVLLDIRLDENDMNNRDGLSLLRGFLASRPDIPILMISGYGDMDTVIECMQIGAVDFIQKPPNLTELRQRLNTAFERVKTVKKVLNLENRLHRLEPFELVGESPKIKEIRALAEKVAVDGHITVLIRGESGTGKELVARSVHRLGRRSNNPFVVVNTPAIPYELIESELFGHEKGAFTGALNRRVGFIENANGGVLFLDEIGELPNNVQVKFLRFLQERTFSRLGSTKEIKVDVQIVAATNKELESAVAAGRFREDLYYRLKGIEITLPPLRERPDDISLLAEHFLSLFREQGRTRAIRIGNEAVDALTQYNWPGNVRELQNVMERAVLTDNLDHTEIAVTDLPREVFRSKGQQNPLFQPSISKDGIEIEYELARCELKYIEDALHLAEGRKSEAWKLLGLNDRFALLRRVKTIFNKYPELKADFPLIDKSYRQQ